MDHTKRTVSVGQYWQGAQLRDDGAFFRVWAPTRREVILVLPETQRRIPMIPDGNGFHDVEVPGLRAGTRYWYELDGRGPFPDPCSRHQPDGPLAASALVDPRHSWHDDAWPGVRMQGQVIYEIHVGTFTREGSFDALRRQLPYLRELGITLIELMPVSECAGERDWGYNGVGLYAPYHVYGHPDDLKRMVDEAHQLGIGVALDVVYNHFGDVGNFFEEFSPAYFTDRYEVEWGKALNFDGPDSGPVREFILANACYWIEEFHIDGLRVDATQAIHDSGPRHLVAELVTRSRAAAGSRGVLLIAENEPQRIVCITPQERGGWGMDAAWHDDFHHVARAALTGSRDGYQKDYAGTAQEMISCVRHGYLYQGQRYTWQGQGRGSRVTDQPAAAFVNYLQNHDQVANTHRGLRLACVAQPAALRAMTALLLLAPETPMLFMGQETGCSRPFPFFSDPGDEIAPAVLAGRRKFIAQFAAYASPEAQSTVPDPSADETFDSAKLDVSEAIDTPMFRLHRDLIRLRREHPAIAAQSRQHIDGAVFNDNACVLRWDMVADDGEEQELLLILNLGRQFFEIPASTPLLAGNRCQHWRVLWSSEHPDYGGTGVISPWTPEGWRLPPVCATLLVPGDENGDDHHEDSVRGS